MVQLLLSAILFSVCLKYGTTTTAAATTRESTESKKPPNIVIILADDLGLDDVSFRGNREFLTPNIDALAYHGRILDRLYAPAMCTPSRGALLTGRYPIHTGTQHYVISNEEPWALPTNVTTLAELLQQQGYSTNLIGKWHLGFSRPEYTPTHRGFDYHFGYWGGYIDYYQRRAQMPNPNISMGFDFRRNMQLECAAQGEYVTDLLTREAERLIREQPGKQQPLFLMLSHLAPHTGNEDAPLQAPPEELRKFAYIKDPRRRIYAAMVSKLDASVGRIVHALSQAGELEHSIVLFYSDNGAPTMGMFSNTGSNWPLRGQKNSPWEGGVRVAGAIWSPLLEARGSIFRQPIYVGDWLPTLAHAAGVRLPPALQIDGIDLWPQLAGPAEAPLVPREILHSLDDVWRFSALMLGQYKYVNGSTLHGQYDQQLSYRENYDVDPRERRYVVEVRNTPASRALAHHDVQRLTQQRVHSLRAAAAVQCGDMQRGCNALLEECLYDLAADACERNNLRYEPQYADILQTLRQRVHELRASAWPIANRAASRQADPSVQHCTWETYELKPAQAVPVACNYEGLPCGE